MQHAKIDRIINISTKANIQSFLNQIAISSHGYFMFCSGNIFNELNGNEGGSRGIIFKVNGDLADMLIIDTNTIYGRYSVAESSFNKRQKYNVTVF